MAEYLLPWAQFTSHRLQGCRTAMRVDMKRRRLKLPIVSSACWYIASCQTHNRIERHRHRHWKSLRLTHENVDNVRISPPAFYENGSPKLAAFPSKG